jgi:type IV pilus assembly protein PilM
MPHRIIGIDVGSYSVKVALIDRSFKSFEFVEFYERRIQYNEMLSPEESVAIAIQGIVDDQNLHWDVSCCGFPAQRVTSRLVTFPFGSRKKIDQTISLEIETYIPFDIENVVLDYSVVWQTKDASRVLVVYVQKGDLVRELTTLGNVGVDPRYVCVEGVELVNLVNLGMVPPEGAYVIMDLGHSKSTVTICHGKRLGYIRAISIAGDAITQAIAERLHVPYDEAERLKIEMGHMPMGDDEVMDDISREVGEAIRGVVDEFILHLRQTFFTYRESEDIPVEGVYLSGGTSRLPGLDRYLSDALKLNVTFLNVQDFHFNRLDRADAHRHVIPQALSLALKGVSGGGADINLRNGEFAFKGDVEQISGSFKRVAIIVGLVIFLGLINFTAKYYSVKKRIDRMRGDIVQMVKQALPNVPSRALRTPKGAIAIIKSRQADVTGRIEQLEALMGASPLDVLRTISTILPSRSEVKLEVADISIAADRVSFSGVVDNFKAVDTVKLALEKDPMFSDVTTGNVRKGVKGNVKFKISMNVAESGGE